MNKGKIRQLADYAVRECCDHSKNCHWTVSYDELYYHFGAEVTDTFQSNDISGQSEQPNARRRITAERRNQRTHHDRGLYRDDLPPAILS